MEAIRQKIKETVLDKTEAVYGKESEQYRSAEAKLADIRVFPISALDALEGRMNNDEELLERSGMLQFEEALSHMLTEERGLLELIPPLSGLVLTGKEVLDHIHVMQGSLEADARTFMATQEEVKKEIASIQKNEEAKITHLNALEKDVKCSLRQKASDCYEDMRVAAQEIIGSITVDSKKEPDGRAKAVLIEDTCKKIESQMNDVMPIHAERLTCELNQIIEEERGDIAANIITSEILNLERKFDNLAALKKMNAMSDWESNVMTTALETEITYMDAFLDGGTRHGIIGVGGLLTGYLAAGVKRPAVGGIAGAAITYGVTTALAALTRPISLPTGVLCSGVGILDRRKKWIFCHNPFGKPLKEIKEDLSKMTDELIAELRANHVLEDWIDEEVTTQFDSLISGMKLQCGRIADDAVRRLKEAEKNIFAGETECKNEQTRLNELERETLAIVEEVTYIYHDFEDFAKLLNRFKREDI